MNWIVRGKRLLNNVWNWISFELNFIVKWMNESYSETIFAIFDEKYPFFWSVLDTVWANFGHFSYSTSINDSLTIELNNLLNWISRIFFWMELYFELNLGKSNIESNIELIIFWQNSKFELNQIGYRTPLPRGDG